MDTDCTFCRLYEEGEVVVYEDEHFYAQFDPYPVTAGHAEIIPKRHVESMMDLTEDEWSQLQYAIEQVTSLVEESDLTDVYQDFLSDPLDENSAAFCRDVLDSGSASAEPDGYNFGVNDGRAAGRTIDHFHWHVIPRYDGDMEDPAGGVRHVIPEKGNYTN